MRSIKIVYIISLLLLYKLVFTYTIESDDINYCYHPILDFYSDNLLGTQALGRGYTGTANKGGIAAAYLNPASLNSKYKIQFYFETGSKNEMDYLTDFYEESQLFKYKNSNLYGFSYKISDYLDTGILYGMRQSVDHQVGTVTFYDYYGNPAVTFDDYLKKQAAVLKIPVAYHHEDFFHIGASLNFEFYSSQTPVILSDPTNHYISCKAKTSFALVRTGVGAVIDLTKNASFGVAFTSQSSKKVIEETQYCKIKYKQNTFPWELRMGLKYQSDLIPVNLYTDFIHINTSDYSELNSRNDFSAGLEVLYQKFIFRCGFKTQNEYRDMSLQYNDESYWLDDEEHNRNFLTLGGTFTWHSFSFSLAYINSDILASESEPKATLSFSLTFKPSKLKLEEY